MSKKKCLMITIGSLAAVLIVYVALGCLVYCYYEPNIEQEMSRQDGWNAAISEIEEEYRRLRAVQDKDFAAQKRQKERLQQVVKEEAGRQSLLKKDIRGRCRWSAEWRARTEARLVRAQQALNEFKGPKKDPETEAKILLLRQQLEALRIRRNRLDHLIEWRDLLKIWPLPILDRFFEKEK